LDPERVLPLTLVQTLLLRALSESPAAVDGILALRQALASADLDPEELIDTFCRAQRDLADLCYLACYRIRRWISRRYEVEVGKLRTPMDLRFPDWESVQRAALHWGSEFAPLEEVEKGLRICLVPVGSTGAPVSTGR